MNIFQRVFPRATTTVLFVFLSAGMQTGLLMYSRCGGLPARGVLVHVRCGGCCGASWASRPASQSIRGNSRQRPQSVVAGRVVGASIIMAILKEAACCRIFALSRTAVLVALFHNPGEDRHQSVCLRVHLLLSGPWCCCALYRSWRRVLGYTHHTHRHRDIRVCVGSGGVYTRSVQTACVFVWVRAACFAIHITYVGVVGTVEWVCCWRAVHE